MAVINIIMEGKPTFQLITNMHFELKVIITDQYYQIILNNWVYLVDNSIIVHIFDNF